MGSIRDAKEIGIHGPHDVHGSPIARLRARFGLALTSLSVPSTLPRVAAEPTPPAPPADVSSWDLPLELYERWEERVCILHFDGKVPWKQAESLALADVLHQAARTQEAATNAIDGNAKEPPAVQGTLFGAENGPYGRDL